MSNRFRLVAEPALALVPTKLIKNWQIEYAKFLDTDDPKLNLKVYIGHRSITLDERIGMSEGKKIITPKGIQPITDISRYLIIISLTSYENNVLYYLFNYESGFVIMPRKKR